MMLSKRPAETTETDPSEFRFRVIRSYFRLPPEPGGMEEHIAQLSHAQRALGVEVLNLFNSGVAAGPAVQLLPRLNLLAVRPAVLRNILFYSAALRQRRRLRDTGPTILHAHGDWSDFLLAKQLARSIGAIAVAASLHDRIPRAKASLYRLALSGCDPIFTTGKADQVYLEELLGKTVTHLPSAPRDLFFLPQGGVHDYRYDVVSVATLAPKKAPELVLECAKLRPELRFVLVGHGELREALVQRASRERIANLDLPGHKSAAEIVSILESSRVFLSTARREGTPTAALEAMAVGLPVVLTPSNDYRWLVENGENGFVTSGWDPRVLMARVDDILSDEERRRAMGRRNLERAAQYSWSNNALKVTGLMAERLGTRWSSHCPS